MQLATFFPRYLANCIGQAWPHLLYALQRDEPSVQQTPIQIPKPTVVYFQYTNLFLVRWSQCLKNQLKSLFLHSCDFLRNYQILIFHLFLKNGWKCILQEKYSLKTQWCMLLKSQSALLCSNFALSSSFPQNRGNDFLNYCWKSHKTWRVLQGFLPRNLKKLSCLCRVKL